MAERENFILHFVFLAFTAFCLSRVGGHTFRPVRNHIVTHDQVTELDGTKRLERGNRVFVNQVFGPESLEFDAHGRGPYTGLADGRIVRWLGKDLGWHTFALVTRNWSEKMCANGKNSTTSMQWRVEAHCGRPLGLRFDRKSGDLYIADAYYGLMVVGPKGGFARSLAADVAGKPILFTNDLDIHSNGSVFFTSSSQKYNRVNISLILSEGDASGRLLRYDPPTRKTHIVLDGLAYPNGVQLSKDQSCVLFSETSNLRVMKLWLEGSKRYTTDLVTYVPGFPDNVRMNEKGEFWVAVDCFQGKEYKILAKNPESDEISMFSMITRFNEKGETLDVLKDTKGQLMETISEVRQVNGKLWLGTVAHNYIVTFDFGP